MGVEIKATKKTNFKKINRDKNILNSIPTALITEIVARVAACSSDDLFNTSLSCKTLKKIADDKYIIQHVSLDKFSVIPWTSKEEAILDRCASCENPEALYRHGIIKYFGIKKDLKNSGLKYLLRAADLRHLGAMYVIGIIMIVAGGEGKQTGIKIICDAMKRLKTSRKEIREIREKFSSTIGRMWVKNTTGVEQIIRPVCCRIHQLAKPAGWDEDEDVDLECEACWCDQQIFRLWDVIPYYI
ncbi:hypothetical protein DCAR_0520731 [Daucus carota subsp. sativus]|nr:PREDICTED: putative F-box protein At1g67623 [Daucus carota subsp. sativus]WOH01349.1 hypothetical protein DCAR_0520731 [Daucus carota subsp. sativus]